MYEKLHGLVGWIDFYEFLEPGGKIHGLVFHLIVARISASNSMYNGWDFGILIGKNTGYN
jgi:hypothetical protein